MCAPTRACISSAISNAAISPSRCSSAVARKTPGPAWHRAYPSWSLSGIQAAVAAGMGLSILSEMAIQSDHRVLTAREGFSPIDKTELALVASPDATPPTLRPADKLAKYCDRVQAKAAKRHERSCRRVGKATTSAVAQRAKAET